MYFTFWVSYSSGNKTLTSDVFASDRVSDRVFLADSVALLQHVHASLVQSGSCFLKHVLGASAKALRLLLLHITRSRFVRAEFSLRGLELVSANVTPWYSTFGQRRGAGVRLCFPRCAPSMEGSLPASETVCVVALLFLSCRQYLGCECGCFARQRPRSPANAQAQHFCSLLLLLEFAF